MTRQEKILIEYEKYVSKKEQLDYNYQEIEEPIMKEYRKQLAFADSILAQLDDEKELYKTLCEGAYKEFLDNTKYLIDDYVPKG